jgi:hypothetical protein
MTAAPSRLKWYDEWTTCGKEIEWFHHATDVDDFIWTA